MHIRHLGLVDYEPTWHAMQAFTETRTGETPDELWIVEHPPVYTLGLAGKPEHLLQQTTIPLVKTDRGGQITYHGPGQLVVYLLMDLRRRDYGVRDMVRRIEQAIIDTLADYGIEARGDVNAPGVYVGARKIASLGLRIKNHATYHGLSLNVSMDLAPFGWINPCGYAGLEVTRMADLGVEATLAQVAERLIPHLETRLARPQHETEA
ncbi:lipoyl(octanoyl) transferase LipB [Laribacter hongkongensis]|uniref:lipoyl(octanoyl) transferase LipB n=1 Tax=Laribacter hongkongensis TaxID=168471 RepID=UPI001EFE1252|nr:lipoyl(octanoyl) transferase LipB [Laribacter hongkongensis]MCG9116179.1 lipoyl(octanoyl) transferase LipB [Laribacter hongkongensis]